MQISTEIFADAIRQLRERLGELDGRNVTQEEMARRVGCTLAGYRKWEAATAVPRGDWLIRLLALCPDDETRALFGVQNLTPMLPEAAANAAETGSAPLTRQQRRNLRSQAHIEIDMIFDRAPARVINRIMDYLDRFAATYGRPK